jgi:hypothetical protein
MERFIVEYATGDGYTYSSTVTLPVVAESKEAFLLALEDAAEQFRKDTKERKRFDDEEKVCGTVFYLGEMHEDGLFYPPRVYTVDEYFAQLDAE